MTAAAPAFPQHYQIAYQGGAMPDNPPQRGTEQEIPNPPPGTRDHDNDPPPDRVTGQPPKGR